MQQLYLKKLTKQDITKSVAICSESVESFWDIDSNATDQYIPIQVCHVDNPNYYPSDITIHKGYGGVKDWRICGNEWKKLYAQDNPTIGDIMVVRKLGTRQFSVKIINEGSQSYQTLSEFFVGNDNYVILSKDTLDNYDNDTTSNFPLQQIFYGAPGTGKSHEIKRITKGQKIIRTTFHPDSDYSTFVGAYKPSMEKAEVRVVPVVVNNGISLDQNNGTYKEDKIVYKFVKQAFLKAYLLAWKKMTQPKIVSSNDFTLTIGSDTYGISDIDDDKITIKNNTAMPSTTDSESNPDSAENNNISEHNEQSEITQPKNSIREVFSINNPEIRLNPVDDEIKKILKEINPEDFDDAWEKLKNKVKSATTFIEPQYLIIEEINRGNCAQIFGDIFQLLDRHDNGFSTYPIEADTDMQQAIKTAFEEETEYRLNGSINVEGVVEDYTSNYGKTLSEDIQEGRILLLPPNFYIWATMNTSDQSLFPIDSAFKRRWDWQYVPISKGRNEAGSEMNWRIQVGTAKYDWWTFINLINDEIYSLTHSEDKKLGFFFCKANNGIISAETFVSKVLFYLWNDVFKDFIEDTGDLFKDGDEILSFNKFYTVGVDGKTVVAIEKVVLFLKNLKLDPITQDDEDIDIASQPTQFRLNGAAPQKLYEIAKVVVLNFANSNPTMSAQDIRDTFVNACAGIGVSHIVETESEYHTRDGQKSQARSASEIIIPGGDKLYVSTQWRAKNNDDNFIKFMEIVNQKGWGTITL